jgi:hypothetical protein
MANSIDFLKQTKSLNQDTSLLSTDNQTVKDKPSLFDSLLTGSKTAPIENSNNKEELNTDTKVQLPNNDSKEEVGKIKESLNSLENKEEPDTDLKKDINSKENILVKEKTLSTSSLLDRLVLEAKKDVKAQSQEQLKNIDNKVASTQNVNNIEELNTDVKVQLANSDLKEDVKAQSQEQLKNIDNKVASTQNANNTEELNTETKVQLANSDLKEDVKTQSQEQLKNIDNKVASTQNANNTEELNTDVKVQLANSDLKEDVKTQSQEQLKNIDNKVASTQNVNNTEELNTDVRVQLANSDLEEKISKTKESLSSLENKQISKEEVEIGKIKELLNSVENKEVQEKPEVDLKEDVKAVKKEQLIDLEKDLSQVSKNIDTTIVNTDKKINITSKDTTTLDITTKISIDGEDKEKVKRVEKKIEEKIISIDNKQNLETELNIDKVITEVDKNKTVNTEEEILNNSKINISNNISVPLSDTLNSQENADSSKNTQVKSLMDQLIQKNSKSIESIAPEKVDMMQRESASKDFISNIYLSTQKNSINTQNLFNKNEAINLLKDATNIKDVKTSAQILDLGLEDISVDQITETQKVADIPRKLEMDLVAKRNILDNLMLSKNIIDTDIKNLITKSVEASSALLDDTLKISDDTVVNVNSPISYNIQSKIIGARQQMSTMMSDIARQMYENYKPPVTVFKINLNPLELGSIAILMKNDKNNSLSISMNVSNNSTLDALIDNQNVLKTSLNKTFDENTKFNLDFNSSNENNNQSNKQNNQNEQSNQNKLDQQIDTQSILELKEENKDREEKSIDYM